MPSAYLTTPRLASGSAFWCEAKDTDAAIKAIFQRHYTARVYHDHRPNRTRFVGPGECMALITPGEDAIWVWRRFIDDSGQRGVNNAVFRNEGPTLSSALILDAMQLGWRKWPGQRFYTFINPKKVKSSNPGYCYLQAGWRRCGVTKRRGLIILEAIPGVTHA